MPLSWVRFYRENLLSFSSICCKISHWFHFGLFWSSPLHLLLFQSSDTSYQESVYSGVLACSFIWKLTQLSQGRKLIPKSWEGDSPRDECKLHSLLSELFSYLCQRENSKRMWLASEYPHPWLSHQYFFPLIIIILRIIVPVLISLSLSCSCSFALLFSCSRYLCLTWLTPFLARGCAD